MRFVSLLLACAALGACSLSAQAQNLTYTLTGVGDGLLTPAGGGLGTAFLMTPFTFTFTADPAGVTNVGNGIVATPVGNIDFTLGGNVEQFQNAQFALNNVGGSTPLAGVADASISSGLVGETLTAGPLTLSAPQSPVALLYTNSPAFTTTFGTVQFTATTSLTFASTAVPEPGSIALLAGMSAVGAAFLRRRKNAQKAA